MTHLDELLRLVGYDAGDERAIAHEHARLQVALEHAEGELEGWLREASRSPPDTPLLLPGFLSGFVTGEADQGFYREQYRQAVHWLKNGLDPGLVAGALSRLRAMFVRTTATWSAGRTAEALCRRVDLAFGIHAVVFQLGSVLDQLERRAAYDIARVRQNCKTLLEVDSDRLLNAYVQHLEWKILAYRLALDNVAEIDRLPLSPRECDLGRWLEDGGLSTVSPERAEDVVRAHDRLHQLVHMALREGRGEHPQAVIRYLPDIEASSDEIVSVLGECISTRLREVAIQDSLTRLGTRRLFDNDIAKYVHRHQRDGSPLALLLIDVDRFKRVNDRYGHAVGDEVLQMVANALSRSMRASDSLYRWGGEEFAVLAPAGRPDDIGIVAERMRGEIAANGVATVAGEVHVTVSIGGIVAASARGGPPNPDALFACCDENLRRAKASGRNRIVISNYPN